MESMDFTPPFAGILTILLATGYNLLYSILELIDNSISKKAVNVQTIIRGMNENEKSLVKWICVLDDATGMLYQKLMEAFIIGFVKGKRDFDDIGKFSVGMKSAVMNMGTRIVILSKTVGGKVAALYADIGLMRDNNTYSPTKMLEEVTPEFINEHVPQDLYDRFEKQESGTLILVKDLITACQATVAKATDDLKKGISTSYSGITGKCTFTIENDSGVIPIVPLDIFYHDHNQCLDEPAYETSLLVYRSKPGYPSRIIEKNVSKRATMGKNSTNGSISSPVYYEFTAMGKGDNYVKNMTPLKSLPPEDDIIGNANLRVIQVNEANYKDEKRHFTGRLEADRKGVWFNRGSRCVGQAMHLGKKVHDRTTMAAERQRICVNFQASLDDEVGSKFNKQMESGGALPCQPLNDAIFCIYKQVTSPWVKKWAVKEEREKKFAEDKTSSVLGSMRHAATLNDVSVAETSSAAESSGDESVESADSIPSILPTSAEIITTPSKLVVNEMVETTQVVTEEALVEPLAEPVLEAVVEPVAEPVVEPVAEHVEEPMVEPVVVAVSLESSDDSEEEDGSLDPWFVENGYFKVTNGSEVIAQMPYTDGLEKWLMNARLPVGKTLEEAVKHFAAFWNA